MMNTYEVVLPTPAYEIIQKDDGLVLIVGQRHSKVDRTLEQMKKRWHEQGQKHVVSILRENFSSEITTFKNLTYENMNQSQNAHFLKKADVVIFENIEFDHELEKAIHLCEEGRTVIVHFSCPNLLSALHRVYSLLSRPGGMHWRWRFVESLQYLLSQTHMLNAQKESIWAHEFVLVSPEVKEYLLDESLHSFEKFLKTAEENSGILNLNQSIMQLLLRRKIEISRAFQLTRDPVDLDQRLKKVGL